MPKVDSPLYGADAPKEPHLALMFKEGEFVAIPVGAMMALVTDPTKADGVLPLVLAKVSKNALEFVIPAASDKHQKRVTFVAKYEELRHIREAWAAKRKAIRESKKTR
jgi:tRNA A37 threonylcarbamoyladenosine synthetase subunit TsaC/SUA5/YrdC